MEVGVLGPLRVQVSGDETVIRSSTQRRALIYMILHANEVVSTDRIADAVWGDCAPNDIEHAVHTLVYRLRHLVGADAITNGLKMPIRRHDPGYVVEIDPTSIDSHNFATRISSGQRCLATDAERARRELRDALSMWRGEPLLDVAYEPWAAPEIRRLNELYISAVESAARADLELGDSQSVIADLESLTEMHPLRESLWALLWEALARSDRLLDVSASQRRLTERLMREFQMAPSRHLDAVAETLLGSQRQENLMRRV